MIIKDQTKIDFVIIPTQKQLSFKKDAQKDLGEKSSEIQVGAKKWL